MAQQVATLTVSIVTATIGEDGGAGDELYLEAEINSDDNNGVSEYNPNIKYYARLYKSSNISTLLKMSNIGSLGLSSSGLTSSVPAAGETEYLTFTGSSKASLDRSYSGGFTYTAIGKVYDINGVETSVSLTPSSGYKEIKASKEIYGVFEVTYTTKYDLYWFQSSLVGSMLMIFIGSNT